MSAFSLEYSAESFSQLKALDKSISERVLKKIESTLENPRLFFRRLSGRPEYKLRVGDYRIIADIEDQKRTIFIRSIGHRKNVYEKH